MQSVFASNVVSDWSICFYTISTCWFACRTLIDVMILTGCLYDFFTGRRAQAQSDVANQVAGSGGEGEAHKEKDTSHEMVVACCRFLCYFCRTSRQNQKAMFEHFAFLLENSNILLSRSVPLLYNINP